MPEHPAGLAAVVGDTFGVVRLPALLGGQVEPVTIGDKPQHQIDVAGFRARAALPACGVFTGVVEA
jgi:hypothetical protein